MSLAIFGGVKTSSLDKLARQVSMSGFLFFEGKGNLSGHLLFKVERFCSDVVAGECPLSEGDSVRFEGISADDIVLQDCGGLNFCGLGVLGVGVPELKESVSAGFDVVVEDVDAVE